MSLATPDSIRRLQRKLYVKAKQQNAALNRGRNVKYAPYVFTEHGAVMLAAVLNSPIAVGASIQVVRAFVRLRKLAAGYAELRDRLNDLEHQYDGQFAMVFEAIRELMAPPPKALGARIGFRGLDDRAPPGEGHDGLRDDV